MANSTKTVRVTAAQKRAAKGLISRSAKTGRYVSPSVSKIANAKSATRSATTGRYVSKGPANGATASTASDDAPGASRPVSTEPASATRRGA